MDSSLSSLVTSIKNQNQNLTLVTGVFDILHYEHVNFLVKSAQLANKLIVGIESDSRVKHLKGPNRPINDQSKRLVNLEKLHIADHVFVLPNFFDSPTQHQRLIEKLQPDYLAVSAHSPFQSQKRKILQKTGGQLKIVHSHNPHISTSTLITKPPSKLPLSISSLPVAGSQRGWQKNTPTINLLPPTKAIVSQGVYSSWVKLSGRFLPSITHFGLQPTYKNSKLKLETHIINHTLTPPPPEPIHLILTHRLRGTMHFNTPQKLKHQIKKDIKKTKKILSIN